MRSALLTLMLLGASVAHAKDRLSFGGEIDVAYDSNVFRLSETQLEKPGTDSEDGEKYYEIESATDTILEMYGRAEWELRAIGGKKASLRIEPGVSLFVANRKRSYASVEAELTHALWKGGDAFVELDAVPSRFRKNYLVDAEDQDGDGISGSEKTYRSGTSTDVDVRAGVDSRLTRSLDGKISLGGGSATYGGPFQNRNKTAVELRGALDLELTKRIDVGLAYEGSSVTTGSDDEVVVDDRQRIVTPVDRSYQAHAISPSLEVEIAKSVDLHAEYELMSRGFTSTGSSDPYRNRTDIRHTGALELRVRLTKPLRLALGAQMSRAVTNRPNDVDAEPDEVDYERTVAWLGLSARF